MSTRASIHFEYPGRTDNTEREEDVKQRTEAIVYRHSDGYPEGLGQDLVQFVQRLKAEVKDTRLSDPSYLAAKWVVYDVMRHHAWQADQGPENADAMRRYYGDPNLLNFLGVGIVDGDPGDIEYRYHVVCDGKVDTIAYDSGYGNLVPDGVIDTTDAVKATA